MRRERTNLFRVVKRSFATRSKELFFYNSFVALYSNFRRHDDFFCLRTANGDKSAADKIGCRVAERTACDAFDRRAVYKSDILQAPADCSGKFQMFHTAFCVFLKL